MNLTLNTMLRRLRYQLQTSNNINVNLMSKVYWPLYERYFNDYCNDATIVTLQQYSSLLTSYHKHRIAYIVLIMCHFNQSGKYQWGWLEIMQYHLDIHCNLDQLQFVASMIKSCDIVFSYWLLLYK